MIPPTAAATSPSAETPDYEVIIAGAGPVGLTLANLFGLYGIRTLLLEKDLVPPAEPRAVALDDESLRIWQQCGLMETMAPLVAEGGEGDVVFTYRTRTGKAIFEMTQHGRPYGYARGNVFLFHRALEVLDAGAARFSRVERRSGWTLLSCREEDERVVVTARDPAGLDHGIAAAYLVGCDGGRSAVRSQLGIPLRGGSYAESWLIVDTYDPALVDQPLGQGVEVWCDARCPTASIPLPGGFRRWEFLLRRSQAGGREFGEPEIRQLIAARKPPGSAAIVRSLVHTYKACIADRYRQGRVFLAGDAAHLSPPFAGQGLATGLRDAANLAWKLAEVVRGDAPESLLASYESERRPHQLRMLGLARRMGRMMMPRTRLHELLVTALFTVAGRSARLRRSMEIRGANITPVYPSGPTGRPGRSGHYLIQPPLGSVRLDDLLGVGHAVISFDRSPHEALSGPELAYWRERSAAFVWIRPEGETATACTVFRDWLGGSNRLLLVRPDRFVGEDRELPALVQVPAAPDVVMAAGTSAES